MNAQDWSPPDSIPPPTPTPDQLAIFSLIDLRLEQLEDALSALEVRIAAKHVYGSKVVRGWLETAQRLRTRINTSYLTLYRQ